MKAINIRPTLKLNSTFDNKFEILRSVFAHRTSSVAYASCSGIASQTTPRLHASVFRSRPILGPLKMSQTHSSKFRTYYQSMISIHVLAKLVIFIKSLPELILKKRMRRILFSFIFLLFLPACSTSKLPRYSIIQGMRVLALTLDQPEINYNGSTFTPSSVQLTPTISDLYGGGRSLQASIEWCLDPGIALGVTPTCKGNATRVVVGENQAITNTATFLSPNYTGSLNPITIDLTLASQSIQSILSASFLALKPYQQYNGINFLIFYTLSPVSDSTQAITTFKRLVVSGSSKASKNQNPSGLSIQDSTTGIEMTSLPTIQTSLTAYVPASQAENYSEETTSGTFNSKTESIQTEWFFTGPSDPECSKKKECTSDGYFKLARSIPSEINVFYPPSAATPTTRGRILVGVVHDSRGGNSVKRYCDGICP